MAWMGFFNRETLETRELQKLSERWLHNGREGAHGSQRIYWKGRRMECKDAAARKGIRLRRATARQESKKAGAMGNGF
jgi:hypothetical protein